MKKQPGPAADNPSVILPVKKQVTVDYLRYLFEGEKNHPLFINRKIPEGKYIHSMVRYSDVPVRGATENECEHIELLLPKTALTTAGKHFTYFTREDTAKINDHLESSFEIFFRSFSMAGEFMGIRRKDVIEAFIVGTNMKFDDRIFERFKKNDYRFRLKMYNFLLQSIKTAGLQ